MTKHGIVWSTWILHPHQELIRSTSSYLITGYHWYISSRVSKLPRNFSWVAMGRASVFTPRQCEASCAQCPHRSCMSSRWKNSGDLVLKGAETFQRCLYLSDPSCVATSVSSTCAVAQLAWWLAKPPTVLTCPNCWRGGASIPWLLQSMLSLGQYYQSYSENPTLGHFQNQIDVAFWT